MKKRIQFISLSVMLLLLSIASKAQTINGKITDRENGKPISGASVYLNGTYKGTSSDHEGRFILYTDQKDIPLIVSFVGYETQTINNYYGKDLTIHLKRKINQLREVVIGYSAMSREEEMEIFLTQFLGGISKDCIIANPDDISFTYHSKTKILEAEADQPLVIINKKLGYKINYFLSLFKYVPGELAFQGNYFFAEDTALLAQKEIKKIIKARNAAYSGSRMHFIRSLWADEFKDEGFVMYDNSGAPISYGDIVISDYEKKFMSFSIPINIIYKKHYSAMKPIQAGRRLLINSEGFFDPMILWGGDLGTKRVNELLPFEFKPTLK